MPLSKHNKIVFFASLFLTLPVGGFLVWLSVENGMWKKDILALAGAAFYITILGVLNLIGYQLRNKIHPTERHINLLFISGTIALFVDALAIVFVAATIGVQMWMVWIVGPICLFGMSCFAAVVFARGALPRIFS